MALKTRVWGAGKLLFLIAALAGTYLLFFAVAVRMAIRAREVPVPDLTGRTVQEASALLAERGLTLKVDENRRLHPTVPAGRISQQDPAAGTVARRQRTVRAWISLGPRSARVPAVTGETERMARTRLQQDGLTVSDVAEVRTSEFPPDVVIAQSPPPGSSSRQVALLVNRGERSASYVMPDLIGVDGDRAADYLRRRGFRVTVVGDLPYPGVPAGIVIRQTPPGGFQIAPGEPISLEVSR
ncbi:MAG TPA: PASTA domain-containing protein [Vicinamibacterales bacterium]|nr:PASTA domain-containing protein [Vicinamibacterales bacterium]